MPCLLFGNCATLPAGVGGTTQQTPHRNQQSPGSHTVPSLSGTAPGQPPVPALALPPGDRPFPSLHIDSWDSHASDRAAGCQILTALKQTCAHSHPRLRELVAESRPGPLRFSTSDVCEPSPMSPAARRPSGRAGVGAERQTVGPNSKTQRAPPTPHTPGSAPPGQEGTPWPWPPQLGGQDRQIPSPGAATPSCPPPPAPHPKSNPKA